MGDVTTIDQENLSLSDESKGVRLIPKMTNSSSVASFDILSPNGNEEMNGSCFYKNGSIGEENKTIADHLEKLFDAKFAKMAMELEDTKQKCMFAKLEAENKVLQAELKHQKLLSEHTALEAKVAKIVEQFLQHQNDQKVLNAKFDQRQTETNLEKKQQKEWGMVNELEKKLNKMEQEQKKKMEKEKDKKEKEKNDFADQLAQLRDDQANVFGRMAEFMTELQTKVEKMEKQTKQQKKKDEEKDKSNEGTTKCDQKSNEMPYGKTMHIRALANNKIVSAWNANALNNSKFMSSWNAGSEPLAACADEAREWEQFLMVDNNDGTVSLLSKKNGRFVSADLFYGYKLIANKHWKFHWEKFRLIRNSDGTVSFQAMTNDKFVSANDDQQNTPLIANKAKIGKWEKFELIDTI